MTRIKPSFLRERVAKLETDFFASLEKRYSHHCRGKRPVVWIVTLKQVLGLEFLTDRMRPLRISALWTVPSPNRARAIALRFGHRPRP
jgi:hypothetical protein